MREIKIRKSYYIYNQIIILVKSLYEVLIIRKELSNISGLKIVIPDRYISIFNKEILLKKHKPKVSKSLGDWNIHIQINYSSEDDLKDLMKLLVNYKVIDEKTNKIINCNCEVKQFIKAIKHKPVI